MNADNTTGPASPRRRLLEALRLLVAIVGAPLAWVLQMSLSEPLAAQACYPGGRPLAAPLWPSLQLILVAIGTACVLAALASLLLAWSGWKAERREAGNNSGNGRSRFLAVLGLMSASLFFAATLFTALALLLIAPCAKAA